MKENVIRLTTREAVQFAVDNGIEEAHKQLETLQKGRSLSKNQSASLFKHLQRLAENVEITKEGRKTVYILTGLKSSPSERIDGRFDNEGRKPTKEDYLMDEYIFNRLLQLSHEGRFTERPLSEWIQRVGLFNVNRIRKQTSIESLNELHQMTMLYTTKDGESSYYDLIAYLNKRNNDVVQRTLGRLQKDGRIVVEQFSVANTIKGSYERLEPFELVQIERTRNSILETYQMDLQTYTNMVARRIPRTDELEEIQSVIDEAYRRKHDIRYYFTAIKIEIKDDSVQREVSRDEMLQAFYTRLLVLIKSRAKRNEGSPYFEKKYFLVNALTMLKGIIHFADNNVYEDALKNLEKDRAGFKAQMDEIKLNDFF